MDMTHSGVKMEAMRIQQRYIRLRLLRRLGSSPAPQYRAMSTLAPIPIPMDIKWNRVWAWVAAALAEMATSLSWPSITVSIMFTPTVMTCWAAMGPPMVNIF